MPLSECSRDKQYVYALLIAICVYSAIFSVATCWKHYQFNSYAWDLGTFDQILHDSVFEGKPFYYTLDLFMNSSGQYFSVHFTPILILLLPLYRLFPVPQLLLVVKSIAIGAAAYPLYLLTRKLTGSTRTGVLLGLAYLLSPCIQGANWFDFQPQSLLPLLIFSAYYFLESGRSRFYLPALALTLLVEEHSSVIVLVMFGVFLLGDGVGSLPHKLGDRRIQAITLLTVAMSVFLFAVSIYFKQLYPHDPQFSDIYVSTGAYSVLGFEGNAFTAPLYALTHPTDLMRAVSYDSVLKALYVVFLFAPLFFAPFRSGPPALAAVLLTPFLLSNYRAYYMIGAHYPFYIMPLMFISTAYFLRRRSNGGYGAAAAILVSTAVFALALSPLSPASTYLSDDSNVLWYPRNHMTPTEVAGIHTLIDSIPREASILTQNHLFPHVSGRINAYAIPVTPFRDTQLPTIEEYLRSLMERSEYILLDPSDGNQLTPIIIHLVKADENLKPIGSVNEVTLYRRLP
jgi:uncharacterized membrane protein